MESIFDTEWYRLEQGVYEQLGRRCAPGEALVIEMNRAMATAARLRQIGKGVKADMFAGIPGFADLLRWVRQQAQLRGLDGRILTVRKAHAALNMLIQSAGATVCKRWLLLVDAELQHRGLRPMEEDYELLIFCHDELQYCARTTGLQILSKQSQKTWQSRLASIIIWDCPMAGSGKIGRNWAETH